MTHTDYQHENGLIYMCAHCKKIKEPETQQYIHIPKVLEDYLMHQSKIPVDERNKENYIYISHGICHDCLGNWFRAEGIDVSLEQIVTEMKKEEK